MRRLGLGTFGVVVACAVAGLALLLSWPAAAQTTICDTDFLTGNWQLKFFSCPAGNSVTATQQATGGSTSLTLPNPQPPATCPLNSNNRDVGNILSMAGNGIGVTCPGESTVYGVHTFSVIYDPASSGAIGSIDFQIDYECLGCPFSGQSFGPALLQSSRYFVANAAGTVTAGGVFPPWNRFSTTTPLLVAAFNEISVTGTGATAVIKIDTNSHPDFSATAPPIQCGFYTGNATVSPTYSIQARYDNWACTITPAPGILKVCKVAGPGIAVGTSFGFTFNGGPTLSVPAGPGPGGTCVVGPSFPVGTTVNVIETILPNYAVSNITVAVAPPGSVVSTDNTTGTASVIIGSGVTEVTYTDYNKPGYLEICKSGVGSGSFTVNPGGLGPFVVAAGTCSPAIQVSAGSVMIKEVPSPGIVMNGCTTIPSSRLVSCNTGTQTATVTVVPGDVSSQTIATINNRDKYPRSTVPRRARS